MDPNKVALEMIREVLDTAWANTPGYPEDEDNYLETLREVVACLSIALDDIETIMHGAGYPIKEPRDV